MKTYIKVSITGPNVRRFLKRLRKINVYNIKFINRDSMIILISLNDYEKLYNIKTIYNIKIISYKGYKDLKNKINKYKVFIISNIVTIILIIFISNFILKINIVHENEDIRNFMKNTLIKYGIKEHKLKKSRDEIKKIINDIVINNKDKIEWLEIEENGTTLNVRLEERKINKVNNNNNIVDIVASKNGIIKKIEAINGDIVACINCYVNKGDLLINSEIKLNEEVKNSISAKGKIYAEVWYKSFISSPYIVHYDKITNNKKYVLNYKLNYDHDLIGKSYKNYIDTNLVSSRYMFSPLIINLKKEQEIIKYDMNLTDEELKDYMIKLATKKLNLKKDSHILKASILSEKYDIDKLNIEVFFTVYENIAEERVKY